jgi:hypothetical protein
MSLGKFQSLLHVPTEDLQQSAVPFGARPGTLSLLMWYAHTMDGGGAVCVYVRACARVRGIAIFHTVNKK